MSDTELDTSDATLDPAKLDLVLAGLDLAAADAAELGDYLSYSTVLDMHLSNPTRYSRDEREQLLAHLLDTFQADDSLVFEVGWDLPALLLPYVDADFDFAAALRQMPGVYCVIKLFEVLANKGNAKELFLKGTELLSTLRAADSPGDEAERATLYDFKLYCVVELVASCMRRIRTTYPLRFLAMTVTALVNAAYANPPRVMKSVQFLLKRMYTFARAYQRPPLPEGHGLSPEELAKLRDDEDYLQRKLLTAFVSEGINLALRADTLGLAVDYFNHLQALVPAEKRHTNDFKMDLPVLDRLYELALLFDLDLSGAFARFVTSSEQLIDFASLADKPEDAAVTDLFEKTVVDFQKTFAHSLVDAEATDVKESLSGLLTLYTYSIGPQRRLERATLTVPQAVALSLRVILPGLVHPSFVNRGLHDVAVFWLWFAVHNVLQTPNGLELAIAAVPHAVLQLYLQALLFTIVSTSGYSFFRYVTLTLLTKVLSLAPEDVAYLFLKNSLLDCPYENVKAALVGVLKELLTQNRLALDELADLLKSVALDAPPLPKREAKPSTKYINLTKDRAADIFSVIDKTVQATFPDGELNVQTVPTLQAYLNLLFLLTRDPLVEKAEVAAVIESMLAHIELLQEKLKGDAARVNELNAVGLLSVTVDRLRERNEPTEVHKLVNAASTGS